MFDPTVLSYLQKRGLVKVPVAPPMTEETPDQTAVAPVTAPPSPALIPGTDFGGKEALAVGVSGLGDAISASAGRPTATAKTALDVIQNAPVKAAERATAIRTASDLAEKDDPASATSKMYQTAAAKYMGKDPTELSGVSASKLEKIFPTLEKFASTELTRKSMEGIADDNRAMRETVLSNAQDWKNHMIGEKESQFNERQWADILNKNNPNNAGSRTAIGLLGRANLNADRAMVTLTKPTVTNQEAGNIMADIASIYQGGAPTQFGMSHQQYDTLYGSLQGMLQHLTGKPQDALPNDIKARLVGVLKDMKATNGHILKDQLDTIEKTRGKVLRNYPQEWKDFRSQIEGSFGDQVAPPPGGGQDHDAALAWAEANPTDPRSATVKEKAQAALGKK